MFWIALGVLLVSSFYWFCIRPHSHFKKRGIKQGFQVPLLGDAFGLTIYKDTVADWMLNNYFKFPEERFSGMYQFVQPTLIIRDPDLIRQIAIKDFDHFTDHVAFLPDDLEPLWSSNVFSLKGEKWKQMRATLSPAFTSSKMRAMFELMSQCAEQFTDHFLKKNRDVVDVEMKDTFTRYANDVIATCAFAVRCDSLEEPENEFYMMGKKATSFNGFGMVFKLLFYSVCPKISKMLGMTFFAKSVGRFFTGLVADSVKMREETKMIRPDMIHLLMEARKGKLSYDEEKTSAKETGFATVEESSVGTSTQAQKQDITLLDMAAQALIFFFGGFDTVSSMMCFMSHEVAINPDIQKRLLEEVDETIRNGNGKLTYEAVNKMTYLDMVIAETLRKWPAVVPTDRVCVKPYTIESQKPSEPTVYLEKGDAVLFPVWGLHRDPKYFPNPDKFDPERFSDENKDNIKPYTYLPFGVGPRNCIASRFALVELKTVFVHILSKFEIVVTEKTTVPLKLAKGFDLKAKNGFNLGLKKRNI